MVSDKKQKSRICFVVGQIGTDDSAARVHSDWVFDEVIMPVFEDMADFKVLRADKVSTPGLIDTQIISHLLSAELVIADLTGLNPNAFYESGIRHVVQKPIIHMHLAGETIPFDISLFRSLKFSIRRPADIRAAKSELAEMVETVLASDYEVENPVTNARGRIRFDETATAPDKLLREELESVKARLSFLERGEDAPESSPPPPKLASKFVAGEKAFHVKFGYGTVESVDENKLWINFDKAGRKKVLDSFVSKG